jgi:hypothetical protein
MLEAELARQARLKAELASEAETAVWLDEAHVSQSYKQLQFCDLLALYFNRTHPAARGAQAFAHVPADARNDVAITIEPQEDGVYRLAPFPFAADGAEFAYAGRRIAPHQHERAGGWPAVLRQAPTVWERFRLVA